MLIKRLYRYASDPRRKLGFSNAPLLKDGYVMGATRHLPTDWAGYILSLSAALFILLHAGRRIIRSSR